MLKKTKRKWPFIKREMNGGMAQSHTCNLKESPSGKWYQSIHDCPLSVFIACACDEVVSPLVISGKVSEDILQETWKAIYLDYSDALLSETEQAAIIMDKKIVILESRITRAYAIKTVLSFRWSEDMETEFLKLGVVDSRYPETVSAQESWWKRAVGRIKRWEVELDSEVRRRSQLIQSTSAATEKVTRESFQDFIVQVEKYLKFPIKESETTVARFMAMVKDYQRHIIALSKANKK